MMALFPLPRLIFGRGALSGVSVELSALGVRRPLLVSDRGLERAGLVAAALRALPDGAACYLDVPENPTAAGADGAFASYRAGECDGVVALGGGSVLDTAKIVAGLASGGASAAADLLGKPDLIRATIPPLIAIPTTIGTGSESSPVAALHFLAGGPAVGTRSFRLVPRTAICDPELARTLPPRLIAATGIDALSHCLEGYFAEPANPIVDALALDGLLRVYIDLPGAVTPGGEAERASLMAAAFEGGVAIHKGLGPAHAIALACGDQDLHHGSLIAAALPLTTELLARNVSAKAARMAERLGLSSGAEIADALRRLTAALGLPASYREAGYQPGPLDSLLDDVVASPFNRTSAYVPTRDEYRAILQALLA